MDLVVPQNMLVLSSLCIAFPVALSFGHEKHEKKWKSVLSSFAKGRKDMQKLTTLLSSQQTALLATRIRLQQGLGEPLPQTLRTLFEQQWGVDLSALRLHTDHEAAALARQLHARAFTAGRDIFFAPGTYDPCSAQGLHLLAHEVVHVIQQASEYMKGAFFAQECWVSEPDDLFERQAQSLAASLLAGSGQASSERVRPLRPLSPVPQEALVIQCAIGLEIEVPIPIDWLTATRVATLQGLVQDADNQPSNDMQRNKRFNVKGFVEKFGKVEYGAFIPAANGYRVDADTDSRILDPTFPVGGWPLREGGYTSIIEIVVDPPVLNTAGLHAAMGNIQQFLTQAQNQTNHFSTRWTDAYAITPPVDPKFAADIPSHISVGPMGYIGYPAPAGAQLNRYNLQGSVQVNLGIDLREFDELLSWYSTSSFSDPANAAAEEQAMFQQIRSDIVTAVAAARTIRNDILKDAPVKLRTDSGNMRGICGWFAYLALYLVRGAPGREVAGNLKNISPILLKTPNDIAIEYGLTIAERQYYMNYREKFVRELFSLVGRSSEANKKFSEIDVSANLKGAGKTVDFLVNPLLNAPLIYGKVVLGPTGVGARRTGNNAVQLLPDVDAQYVGGGPNTRGGILVEFRALPGYYNGINAWEGVGNAFLAKANELNQKNGID